jgi:hypothetical protein
VNLTRTWAVLRMAARLTSLRSDAWLIGGCGGAAYVLLAREGWTFGGMLAVSAGCLWAVALLVLASGLAQQNHPQLARLVPGQLGHLRQVLRWGMGLLLAIGVACVWAWTGGLGNKFGLMTLLMVMLMWAQVCAGLRRWLWIPVPVAVVVGVLAGVKSLDAAAGLPALVVGAVAALLWGAPKLLRTGDAAHSRAHEAALRVSAVLRASTEGGSAGNYYRVGWMAALMHGWLMPMRQALGHHAGHAVHGSADAIGRALWLVSPTTVALQQAWSLLWLGALLLLPWALLVVLAPSQGQQVIAPAAWPVGALQGLFLLTLLSCRLEHWSSRQGQALLRLTPLQPRAADLPRVWQALLQRHAARGWLMHSSLALGLAWWVQPGAWLAALVGCLMSLPLLAATVCTDWARLPRPVTPSAERSWLAYGSNPTMQAFGQAALCAVPALLWPYYGAKAGFQLALLALALACLAATAWQLRPPAKPQQAPWPAGRWSA